MRAASLAWQSESAVVEGSRPPEFEVAMASAIAAPEAFGASYDVAPASEALELGEGLEGDPAVAFRRTLGMFATGVTVLTTRVGEQVHGMTANAFMSVSLRPPLVLISIDRRARMGALLHEGTRFGVSVLEAKQTGLSDRFAGTSRGRTSRGDVRGRSRDTARRGRARAPRRAGRAFVLGRRSLALPRPGRVRALRRRVVRCCSTVAATSG